MVHNMYRLRLFVTMAGGAYLDHCSERNIEPVPMRADTFY